MEANPNHTPGTAPGGAAESFRTRFLCPSRGSSKMKMYSLSTGCAATGFAGLADPWLHSLAPSEPKTHVAVCHHAFEVGLLFFFIPQSEIRNREGRSRNFVLLKCWAIRTVIGDGSGPNHLGQPQIPGRRCGLHSNALIRVGQPSSEDLDRERHWGSVPQAPEGTPADVPACVGGQRRDGSPRLCVFGCQFRQKGRGREPVPGGLLAYRRDDRRQVGCVRASHRADALSRLMGLGDQLSRFTRRFTPWHSRRTLRRSGLPR